MYAEVICFLSQFSDICYLHFADRILRPAAIYPLVQTKDSSTQIILSRVCSHNILCFITVQPYLFTVHGSHSTSLFFSLTALHHSELKTVKNRVHNTPCSTKGIHAPSSKSHGIPLHHTSVHQDIVNICYSTLQCSNESTSQLDIIDMFIPTTPLLTPTRKRKLYSTRDTHASYLYCTP